MYSWFRRSGWSSPATHRGHLQVLTVLLKAMSTPGLRYPEPFTPGSQPQIPRRIAIGVACRRVDSDSMRTRMGAPGSSHEENHAPFDHCNSPVAAAITIRAQA